MLSFRPNTDYNSQIKFITLYSLIILDRTQFTFSPERDHECVYDEQD